MTASCRCCGAGAARRGSLPTAASARAARFSVMYSRRAQPRTARRTAHASRVRSDTPSDYRRVEFCVERHLLLIGVPRQEARGCGAPMHFQSFGAGWSSRCPPSKIGSMDRSWIAQTDPVVPIARDGKWGGESRSSKASLCRLVGFKVCHLCAGCAATRRWPTHELAAPCSSWITRLEPSCRSCLRARRPLNRSAPRQAAVADRPAWASNRSFVRHVALHASAPSRLRQLSCGSRHKAIRDRCWTIAKIGAAIGPRGALALLGRTSGMRSSASRGSTDPGLAERKQPELDLPGGTHRQRGVGPPRPSRRASANANLTPIPSMTRTWPVVSGALASKATRYGTTTSVAS